MLISVHNARVIAWVCVLALGALLMLLAIWLTFQLRARGAKSAQCISGYSTELTVDMLHFLLDSKSHVYSAIVMRARSHFTTFFRISESEEISRLLHHHHSIHSDRLSFWCLNIKCTAGHCHCPELWFVIVRAARNTAECEKRLLWNGQFEGFEYVEYAGCSKKFICMVPYMNSICYIFTFNCVVKTKIIWRK